MTLETVAGASGERLDSLGTAGRDLGATAERGQQTPGDR
jgi:hypothetical protein